MVPLYLKHIPIVQYGAWLAGGNLITLISYLDPGISSIVQQRAATLDGQQLKGKARRALLGGVILTSILVSLMLLFGFVISKNLDFLVNTREDWVFNEFSTAWLLAFIGICLMQYVHIFVGYGNGIQKGKGIGLINTLSWATSLCVGALLLNMGYGVLALGIMPIVQASTALVGNIIFTRADENEKISISEVNQEIIILVGNIKRAAFGRLATSASVSAESILAARVLGLEETAILGLTRRLPEIGRLVLERPCVAILPSLTHMAAERGEQSLTPLLERASRWYIWLTFFFLCLFLASSYDFIKLWIGSSNWGGGVVASLAVVSSVLSATISNLYNTRIAISDYRTAGKGAVLHSFLFVTLVTVGGYNWGASGFVAGAVLAGTLSITVLIRATSERKDLLRDAISNEVGEFLPAGGSALIALGAGLMFTTSTWLELVCKGFIIFGSYACTLLVLSSSFRREATRILHHKYNG